MEKQDLLVDAARKAIHHANNVAELAALLKIGQNATRNLLRRTGLHEEFNTLRGRKSLRNHNRSLTPEHRAALSAAAKNRKKGGGMTGRRHTPQTREKIRQATLRQLAEGRFSHVKTKPHLAVRDFLVEIGCDFTEEQIFHGFSIDFMIGGKLALEVNGDYWHSNPKKYPNGPEHPGQHINANQDRRKMAALRQDGIPLIVIWESDVNDGSYRAKLLQMIVQAIGSIPLRLDL